MKNLKILTFQYNSVYQHGGAGRVLRRLFEGREAQVTSLFIKTSGASDRTGNINELSVSAFPLQRKWMRWRFRTLAIWLRESFFKDLINKRVREAASKLDFDVIHVVNHGPFSTAFCDASYSDKPLWVSFHDHYSTCSTLEDASKLWKASDRRLVISIEMGIEYQRLFGNRDFDVITDGVAINEISTPKSTKVAPAVIYFAGLLHFDYLPLFRALADSIDLLINKGVPLKLVLRGTQKLDFLDNRKFEVEYRQDFVTDAQVKLELDAADILYLPIKFNLPAFYLYSLSTKMVGYLGSSGTIHYHGPHDSAACNLLTKYQAAKASTSLDPAEISKDILSIIEGDSSLSANAKELAINQFELEKIQSRFWVNNIS